MNKRFKETINYNDVQVAYDKHIINDAHLDKSNRIKLLIIAYLKFNITPLHRVYTTLNEIVSSCGYTIKGNSKECNVMFKSVLKDMSNNGYIYIDNIDEIKNTQLFIIYCDYDKLFHCDSSFVLLNYQEFRQIVSCTTSTKKANLLHGYLLIKQYIYDNSIINCPKLSYPSKQDLTRKLGFASDTSTEVLIKDLVEAKLIYVKTGMFIKKDDMFTPARSVYALQKSELQYAAEVLKDFYQVNRVYTEKDIQKKSKK